MSFQHIAIGKRRELFLLYRDRQWLQTSSNELHDVGLIKFVAILLKGDANVLSGCRIRTSHAQTAAINSKIPVVPSMCPCGCRNWPQQLISSAFVVTPAFDNYCIMYVMECAAWPPVGDVWYFSTSFVCRRVAFLFATGSETFDDRSSEYAYGWWTINSWRLIQNYQDVQSPDSVIMWLCGSHFIAHTALNYHARLALYIRLTCCHAIRRNFWLH